MSESKCKCSMAISVLGDGCRHCQPQEYIDRMTEWLEEERADLAKAESRITELQRECSRLNADVEERAKATQKNYEIILKLREQIKELQAAYDSAFKQAWDNGDALRIERLKNIELERIIAESKERDFVAYAGDLACHHEYDSKMKLYTSPVIQEGMVMVDADVFNVRRWGAKYHDAWNLNTPDTQKAFEALLEAAKEKP